MGQQQLLLIIIGLIIVGVAIILGLSLFKDYAVDAKRNNLINEGINLAAEAQRYYRKPLTLGGGQFKFSGWKIPPAMIVTESGWHKAIVYDDSVEIISTGNEVVTGSDSVQVKVTVLSTSYRTQIIH
ncbi:MAG: hypothetical protein V1720_00305 [bacterium]